MSLSEETRKKALALLNRRDMSVKEFTDKMTGKGVLPEEAAEAARWLLDLHALDDERYAGLVTRHYAAKGYGKRRIQQELYRRGVPRELWDAALDAMPEMGGPIDRFLRTRLRGRQPDEAEKRRVTNALLRRGYPWSEIRSAWSRLGTELPEE